MDAGLTVICPSIFSIQLGRYHQQLHPDRAGFVMFLGVMTIVAVPDTLRSGMVIGDITAE